MGAEALEELRDGADGPVVEKVLLDIRRLWLTFCSGAGMSRGKMLDETVLECWWLFPFKSGSGCDWMWIGFLCGTL